MTCLIRAPARIAAADDYLSRSTFSSALDAASRAARRWPPVGCDVRLDTDDFDPLRAGTAGFLSEAGQVSGVAREHDGRPRLGERDYGEKRIEGAPMARQAGPAKQFAGRAALLLANRDHGHSTKHSVHTGVPGSAAQDLGQSGRGRDNTALPPSGSLETTSGLRVAIGELDEAFGIERQRAAYGSS